MGDVLKFDITDKSAAYLDELERGILRAMRRTGKNRAKKMQADARVKTGAMRAGVTSKVSKGTGEHTLEVGGTERKTPYIEEGTKPRGRKPGTKAYPFIAPNLEGIEAEFAEEVIFEADKIRDLV